MAYNTYRSGPSAKTTVAGGCGAVILTILLNLLFLGGMIWFVVWLLRTLDVIS